MVGTEAPTDLFLTTLIAGDWSMPQCPKKTYLCLDLWGVGGVLNLLTFTREWRAPISVHQLPCLAKNLQFRGFLTHVKHLGTMSSVAVPFAADLKDVSCLLCHYTQFSSFESMNTNHLTEAPCSFRSQQEEEKEEEEEELTAELALKSSRMQH